MAKTAKVEKRKDHGGESDSEVALANREDEEGSELQEDEIWKVGNPCSIFHSRRPPEPVYLLSRPCKRLCLR